MFLCHRAFSRVRLSLTATGLVLVVALKPFRPHFRWLDQDACIACALLEASTALRVVSVRVMRTFWVRAGLASALATGLWVGGCASGAAAGTNGQSSVTTRPTRTGLWLDCRQDADCGAPRVCHLAVMGGTCAPPCASDPFCKGMNATLVCQAQRCVTGATDPDG